MNFRKAIELWDRMELYITGILAGAATFIAFYQVVMRYVFHSSPEWAEESVLYLILWSIFIISSKLVRDDEHVGADFFIKMLPLRSQKVIQLLNGILALSFLSIVIWYGFQIVCAALEMDERSTTTLRFPLWIAYLAIPSGGCLIFISYIYRLYLMIVDFNTTESLNEHNERRNVS